MTTAPTGNRIIIPFSSGVIGETTYSSSVPLSISFFRDAEGKRVVTTNEEGLLYARGSTVMQGYHGRPEALAACFIPNPFTEGRDNQPWAPVLSLMLGYHMADAILLTKNLPMPKLESQKFLNGPGLGMECSVVRFRVVPAVLGM
jgi:hypothetical protein